VRTPIIFALLAAAALAAEPRIIPIWPGPPPGTEGWTQQEHETVGPKDTFRRVSNVTRPTLTVHLPTSGANGTAMIVCPGGGFRHLAIDHEGHDVARWLNSLGVAAFVLKYRLMPTGNGVEKTSASLVERRKAMMPIGAADGQQAVRLVRSRAAEWGVAPDRVGIMGFSAGGNVATSVALSNDPASRPNFAAPIYPLVPEGIAPSAGAPPIFLVHADDDRGVPSLNNSVRLYSAWKQAQIPAELHIYSRGGHGFGMRKKGLPLDGWTERLRDWMAVQGLLQSGR
jgi:acetyl esterase/lipase